MIHPGNAVVNRFILLSFVVMGWGYYELSGGSGFVPERRTQLAAAADTDAGPVPAAQAATPDPVAEPDPLGGVTIVTRAETGDIDALPEADSIAADAIASDAIVFEADSVADALAQALGEPVIDTGEPAALPEAEQTAALPAAETAPETGPETGPETSAETAALPGPEATPTDATLREVTGDTVNLREGPGTNFTVLGRLTRGTVVSLLDTGPDGWVYVEVDGRIGWMSADFIGPST
jgi:hypothetical protein